MKLLILISLFFYFPALADIGNPLAARAAALCAIDRRLLVAKDPPEVFRLLDWKRQLLHPNADNNHNSFVTYELKEHERREAEIMRNNSAEQNAKIAAATNELVVKTKRLLELREMKKTRGSLTPALEAEAAELEKNVQYDHIVVGRGHTALLAVKTILKKDPNARILMIGEQETFWPQMHFGIALVGDMPGFLSRHGLPGHQKYLGADYLKAHENQHPGYVMGKFIGDHMEEILADPRVTVLGGTFFDMVKSPSGSTELMFTPTGWDYAHAGATTPEFPLLATVGKGNVTFATGLGKPKTLKVLDFSESTEPEKVDAKRILDDVGIPRILDNISAQWLLQEGAMHNYATYPKTVKKDSEDAAKQNRKAKYLITGGGDGALSVFEGLLSGIFRECCAQLPTVSEREAAFVKALGNVEFVWAVGQGAGVSGVAASLQLKRYEKISALLTAMEKGGKLKILQDRIDDENIRFLGDKNPTGPIETTSTAGKEKLMFDRIFNNTGNEGPAEILRRIYAFDNPNAKDMPRDMNALLTTFDWRPTYAPNSNRITGMQILDKQGKVVSGFTGNAGLLFANDVTAAYAKTGAKPVGHLADAANLAKFARGIAELKGRSSSIDNVMTNSFDVDQFGFYVNPYGASATADNSVNYASGLFTVAP